MRSAISILGLVCALVAGCATPPRDYSISNSTTYDVPYDRLWEGIVAFFASKNIPVKSIAKDSGVVFAEAQRFDDSVADCGSPGIWKPMGRRASFNVFVGRNSGRTVVSVNTEFTEVRRLYDNIQSVQCSSRGVLERAVFASLSSLQASGGGTVAPVAVEAVAVPAMAAEAPVPPKLSPPKEHAAAPTALRSKTGEDSYTVERLPEVKACAQSPKAVLTGNVPGVATYVVQCADGGALIAKCEFGVCRILR